MNNTVCCFVPGCPNSEGNRTSATFHEFPEDLQEEWLISIGRNRDAFIIDELICSEHFERSDFEIYDSVNVLKLNAVPSLNLPEEEHCSFITDSQLNSASSSNEEIEQLVKKYKSYEEAKPVNVLNNGLYTVLKSKVDNACETVTLNTDNIFVTDDIEEESLDLSSHVSPAELIDCDNSVDEYHLEYEDVINCRTCLEEIETGEGYAITDVHHGSKTLKEMIVYCIPQMGATLLDSNLVCNKCLESIKFCVVFIENCLKVETDLLENQDEIILLNSTEDNATEEIENESEMYGHITLDHNYIPKTESQAVQYSARDFFPNNPDFINNTKHECLECDRTFKTKNYLLDHIRKLHSSPRKTPIMFECELCEKTFFTKLGYDLHLYIHHHEQVGTKRQSGGYSCKECRSCFATFDDLSEHKQLEHGFSCNICSLRFETRAELDTHSDMHPNGHLCGKGFKKKHNLQIHLLTHTDPNTHLCHSCGQGFKSKLALSLHLKRHNLDLKFRCNLCSAAFPQKYRLELHKKVRHLGLQEYKCNVCDKKFCYKANLNSHHK